MMEMHNRIQNIGQKSIFLNFQNHFGAIYRYTWTSILEIKLLVLFCIKTHKTLGG